MSDTPFTGIFWVDFYIWIALLGFLMFAATAWLDRDRPAKSRRSARMALACLVWPLALAIGLLWAVAYFLVWLVTTAR